MSETILICTVGGSYAPIVKAIEEVDPDRVIFVCTDRDPATNAPGSRIQVECVGKCIKASWENKAPSLPNIPTQAGLDDGQWRLIIVPADDLAEIYRVLYDCLRIEREQHPNAYIRADYTGGTKSMSAGLALAASDVLGTTLQVVVGFRDDLERIRYSSRVQSLSNSLRDYRAMKQQLQLWQRHDYRAAAEGLEQISPEPGLLRSEWQRARDLSQALAEWHDFNHAAALRVFESYKGVVAPEWPMLFAALRELAKSKRSRKRDALLLWDLWLNAERCAQLHRPDDAVARLYRLLEATAQHLLWYDAELDTADLPADLAQVRSLSPSHNGKYQVGLFAAWSLLKDQTSGPASDFFKLSENEMLFHLQLRNHSILAHGFESVGADGFKQLHAWMKDAFQPVLEYALDQAGVRPFDQLPQVYPKSLEISQPS